MQRSQPNKLSKLLMSKLLLHLDADTSIKALHQALASRGHDVTRTPTEWMPVAWASSLVESVTNVSDNPNGIPSDRSLLVLWD